MSRCAAGRSVTANSIWNLLFAVDNVEAPDVRAVVLAPSTEASIHNQCAAAAKQQKVESLWRVSALSVCCTAHTVGDAAGSPVLKQLGAVLKPLSGV